MASSMNTSLHLLLFVAIATSYFNHTVANIKTNITSITLNNGKLYCTMNGNHNLFCGGTSCPPATNATVTLAVKHTNIVVAETTTNSSGLYSFNLTYNATNSATLSLLNIFNVVVYVTLPVANCTALSGAGILVGVLSAKTKINATDVAVTFTPINYLRV